MNTNRFLKDTSRQNIVRGIPRSARSKRLASGPRHRRSDAARLRDRPGPARHRRRHRSPPGALLRHVRALLARSAGAV